MKILLIDIGTGTQDILLYESRLDLENCLKLVLPSPTMRVRALIQDATRARVPILLAGYQMGGGPAAWAAEAHARAGLAVFATPAAASTLDDEPAKVAAKGVRIISEDKAQHLGADVRRIEFRDFDLPAIEAAFSGFGVSLRDLDAVCIAVFDHGAAPPGTSDRQFRFDYIDRRIRERNSLSAFAYLAADIPDIMSRMRAVADSARGLDCPLVVMDTAPAAILGATFDPRVPRDRSLVVNIGNFHTLAFRLGHGSIEAVFEHHTGEIDLPKLETFLRALADGSLRHEDIFNDMGHGALVYSNQPLELGTGDFDVVVTGPRRSMLASGAETAATAPTAEPRRLRPYFAVPFGDMMMAGCYGLLAASADLLPTFAPGIHRSMNTPLGSGTAPWDVD